MKLKISFAGDPLTLALAVSYLLLPSMLAMAEAKNERDAPLPFPPSLLPNLIPLPLPRLTALALSPDRVAHSPMRAEEVIEPSSCSSSTSGFSSSVSSR